MKLKSTLIVALVALGVSSGTLSGATTSVGPYMRSLVDDYEVIPLYSAGDRVPVTDAPSSEFQLVGIPDGLGLTRKPDGSNTLWVNHELRTDTSTEPLVGQPLVRGAFVSLLQLDAAGDVVSGDIAFDTVYDENTLVGPLARSDNTTPAFGRFCSGVLVGPAFGFDRHIFLTNEEAPEAEAFDPRGSSTVAIFDGEAHALPRLGHFEKENSIVMRDTGRRTVVLMFEDGPATPDSQVYLYVGRRSQDPQATPLGRNGFDNGKLYVLASSDPERSSEATFTQGSIDIEWKVIPEAAAMTATELEAAVDGLGAFGFVKVEDGAFDAKINNEAFFVTTGAPTKTAPAASPSPGSSASASASPSPSPSPAPTQSPSPNQLGRIYRLSFDATDPLAPGRLALQVNGDTMYAAGTAMPLAPDNVAASGRYFMVEEGGNGASKPILVQQERDNSLWRFPITRGRFHARLDISNATRVAQVNPPGRDGIAVPPATWDPSGILAARGLFGPDSWLASIQTFPPTTEPLPNTFRDAQLVGIRR